MRWMLSASVLMAFACPRIVLGQAQPSTPDPYQRTHWDLAQELSAGRIQALAQTPDGYLWVGTSEGLFRFDGLHFTPQLSDQKEPLRQVLGLSVDRAGTLWVRTADTHLRRLQNGVLSPPTSAHQIVLGVVTMSAGQTGGLYATDTGKNLIRILGSQIDLFPMKSKSLLISLAETNDGRLWIGTDRGLAYLDRKSQTMQAASNDEQKINCLLPGSNGRVWIGTDDGLAEWDGLRLIQHRIPGQDRLHLQILTIMQDREGNLWLGTSRGLLRYNSAGAEWFSSQTDPANTAVSAVLQDREGDIWFGSGTTLVRLESTAILPIKLADRKTDETFGPLYVDARGRVWFALLQGGLFWMQDGIVHPVLKDGLAKDVVYSIDGRDGDIWVGRRNRGLTRLHLAQGRVESRTWTTLDGLPQNSVYAVRAAPDGTIWAGTLTSGLIRFRDGRFTAFDEQNGLPSNSVSAIEFGKQDELWIGTAGGLCRFDGQRCIVPASTRKAPPQDILSLLKDPSDGLWIGTAKGLSFLDQHGVRNLSIATQTQPMILGIGLDKAGKLWVATDRAVLSTSREQLLASGTPDIRNYGQDDGLLSTEGIRRSRSVVMDESGHVWISTARELAMTVSRTDTLPAVIPHVEEVTADGVSLGILNPQVPAGARRLSFVFTGLNLHAPARVRFRYRLDNFDKSWSDAVSERQATYTNLTPGQYTFRLIASNESNSWSTAESTVPVTVEPLLWQRWPVRLASAALLTLLIAAGYRTRTGFLLAQVNLLSEERLRERTRIAREVHDTLLQGFISSLMHLHVAERQIPADLPLKSKLSFVLEGMERVIEEARLAVVGLRTPDSGDGCLETSLREFFIEVADIGDANLSLHSTGRPRLIKPAAVENITSIGREAILNAVRHANAKSIHVTIVWGSFRWTLQVVDDGRGMDEVTLKNGRPQHWGFASMRERAKHLNAKLEIESRPAAGTKVTLTARAGSIYQRLSRKSHGNGVIR